MTLRGALARGLLVLALLSTAVAKLSYFAGDEVGSLPLWFATLAEMALALLLVIRPLVRYGALATAGGFSGAGAATYFSTDGLSKACECNCVGAHPMDPGVALVVQGVIVVLAALTFSGLRPHQSRRREGSDEGVG